MKDRPAVVTASYHMVQTAFEFDPWSSCHTSQIVTLLSNARQQESQNRRPDPRFPMSMNYLVAVAILSSLTIGSMAQKSQGISHYECKLNQEEDDLVIMLNIAVSQGDENCVRQVLKKGISPSARYDGDVTQSPIISAVFGNRLGIIDALFEAGLDPKSESVKL